MDVLGVTPESEDAKVDSVGGVVLGVLGKAGTVGARVVESA